MQFVVSDELAASSGFAKMAVSAGAVGDPHFHLEHNVRKPVNQMWTFPELKWITFVVSRMATGEVSTAVFAFFFGLVAKIVFGSVVAARDIMGDGAGTHPGSANVQPERKAFVIAVFAISSVTQAAES